MKECMTDGKSKDEILEIADSSLVAKCPKCYNNMYLIGNLTDHGFKDVLLFECKDCEKEIIDKNNKKTLDKMMDIIKQLESMLGSNSNYAQIVDEKIFLVYRK